METKVIRMNPEHIDRDTMEEAGMILKKGGLVAFPTETVYGLGGDALDEAAAEKIYRAKGRPSDNPLIIHIADISALKRIVKEVPAKAEELARVYWPGPLTMIFPKSEEVPYGTTGGMETVAVQDARSSGCPCFDSSRRGICGGAQRQYFRKARVLRSLLM